MTSNNEKHLYEVKPGERFTTYGGVEWVVLEHNGLEATALAVEPVFSGRLTMRAKTTGAMLPCAAN